MKRFILILIAAVAAVTAMQAQPPARTANQDKYYVRRATHFDDLPVYRRDIIMLGNSLTDGAEWNELFNNPHVKNRGIIGDIVQGLYERMAAQHNDVLEEIRTTGQLSSETEAKLKLALENYTRDFLNSKK